MIDTREEMWYSYSTSLPRVVFLGVPKNYRQWSIREGGVAFPEGLPFWRCITVKEKEKK